MNVAVLVAPGTTVTLPLTLALGLIVAGNRVAPDPLSLLDGEAPAEV